MPYPTTLVLEKKTSADGPTDAELLTRVRSGDQAAFRVLIRRYEPRVASIVIRMLGAGSEAEDVGQETFIRFYESLYRFRGEASVGTYLARIAMNLSLNAIKSRQRRRWRFLSSDESPASIPEPSLEGNSVIDEQEQSAQVQWAIHQLPAKHRAVVVLRLIEGYTTRETADLLELPIGTVLSRLARAQEKLKSLLTPYLK